MTKNKEFRDELTAEMHSEFKVLKETRIKLNQIYSNIVCSMTIPLQK